MEQQEEAKPEKQESAKARVRIMNCGCGKKHEYQDGRYGRGRRVFTVAGGDKGSTKYRCTVCGKEAM